MLFNWKLMRSCEHPLHTWMTLLTLIRFLPPTIIARTFNTYSSSTEAQDRLTDKLSWAFVSNYQFCELAIETCTQCTRNTRSCSRKGFNNFASDLLARLHAAWNWEDEYQLFWWMHCNTLQELHRFLLRSPKQPLQSSSSHTTVLLPLQHSSQLINMPLYRISSRDSALTNVSTPALETKSPPSPVLLLFHDILRLL